MDKTILIVDDEKEIRELLRLYIEKDGYSVIQAENGLEALKEIASTRIDLAVIDIMMPELDGYQLIKGLRERSNLPIIVVSAKTENHEKILGLDLGADDYVTKPFDPLEVIARIKAQLRRYDGGAADSEAALLTAGELCMDVYACTLTVMLYVNGVLRRFRNIPAAQAVRFGAAQEKSRSARSFLLSRNRLFSRNTFFSGGDMKARGERVLAGMAAVGI